MIKIALLLFLAASGYYPFTYGKSLWVEEKNKLGGFGAALIAVASTVVPILYIFLKV
jgi:hypothetical protein